MSDVEAKAWNAAIAAAEQALSQIVVGVDLSPRAAFDVLARLRK